jgi:anthranilate synthase component 1
VLYTETQEQEFDLLTLHLENSQRYPHLIESVIGGRYDILFAFPEESLILDHQGLRGPQAYIDDRNFIQALDAWFLSLKRPRQTDLHFEGGWFIFLSYELSEELEPVLDLPQESMQLPVAMASYCPAAVIRDRQNQQVHVIAESSDYLGEILQDIANRELVIEDSFSVPVSLSRLEEAAGERYKEGVRAIKDYIREGDVFQVNLSRPWQGTLSSEIPHARLYAALRASNPAPFAALATFEDQAIISSSPERLIRTRGELIETRPIAGTRPRGDDHDLDDALSSELLAHPKERAEHIMLIDLERNDLGRICQPGSVEVNELMVLESYQHVHHIVSNVRGQLRESISPGQVIKAVFPGGTITGCPKIRCMEIIAELEGEGRGAYTGSLGYLNVHGDMDLNILIRTLVRSGQQIRFRTGAGIVADSDPEQELKETHHKAEGLLRGFDR